MFGVKRLQNSLYLVLLWSYLHHGDCLPLPPGSDGEEDLPVRLGVGRGLLLGLHHALAAALLALLLFLGGRLASAGLLGGGEGGELLGKVLLQPLLAAFVVGVVLTELERKRQTNISKHQGLRQKLQHSHRMV